MGPIGIFAYHSRKYLGLTWTAVVFMFIAMLFWCSSCYTKRNKRTASDAEERTVSDADERTLVDETLTEKGSVYKY
jgi:hypothetical protein